MLTGLLLGDVGVGKTTLWNKLTGGNGETRFGGHGVTQELTCRPSVLHPTQVQYIDTAGTIDLTRQSKEMCRDILVDALTQYSVNVVFLVTKCERNGVMVRNIQRLTCLTGKIPATVVLTHADVVPTDPSVVRNVLKDMEYDVLMVGSGMSDDDIRGQMDTVVLSAASKRVRVHAKLLKKLDEMPLDDFNKVSLLTSHHYDPIVRAMFDALVTEAPRTWMTELFSIRFLCALRYLHYIRISLLDCIYEHDPPVCRDANPHDADAVVMPWQEMSAQVARMVLMQHPAPDNETALPVWMRAQLAALVHPPSMANVVQCMERYQPTEKYLAYVPFTNRFLYMPQDSTIYDKPTTEHHDVNWSEVLDLLGKVQPEMVRAVIGLLATRRPANWTHELSSLLRAPNPWADMLKNFLTNVMYRVPYMGMVCYIARKHTPLDLDQVNNWIDIHDTQVGMVIPQDMRMRWAGPVLLVTLGDHGPEEHCMRLVVRAHTDLETGAKTLRCAQVNNNATCTKCPRAFGKV